MAVGLTPHSPNVLPSGANIPVQSKLVADMLSSLGSGIVIANSTAAAITSSVSTLVKLILGLINIPSSVVSARPPVQP